MPRLISRLDAKRNFAETHIKGNQDKGAAMLIDDKRSMLLRSKSKGEVIATSG